VKNRLDKAFKKKLEHGTAPYPDDLWDKIEAQLPTKKKTPTTLFGKFGALGLGLLLLGLVLSVFLLNDGKDKTSLTENRNLNPTQNTLQEKDIPSATNSNLFIDQTQEGLTTQDPISSTINSSIEDLTNNQSLAKIQSNSSIPTHLNSNLAKEASYIATQNQFSVQKIYTNHLNQRQLGNQYQSTSNSQKSLFTEGVYERKTTDVTKPFSGSKAQQNKAVSKNSTNLFVQPLRSKKIAEVQYLKSNRRKYNAKKLLTECPAFVITGGKGIIMDFYFSPDFAMREFNPRDIEFNNYSTERENTENPYLSYSAGMRISYVNKSGLALRSGINFTQINEAFKYLNTNVTGIDTIIKIENGTNVRDTTFVEIGETVEIKTHNRYRSLDVPLLLGLEMPFNKKVKLSLNAGVFVNLLFHQRGRYIDQQGHPNWFVDQSLYKTSLGLSYYGSLGVNYYINPRMDFMMEPNLRYYSQSFTVNEYPLTQEYLKFGLLTGLRYHF